MFFNELSKAEVSIAPTLKLSKYKSLLDWYKKPENHDYSKSNVVNICGIPHTLAWGGLHGATGEIQYKKDKVTRLQETVARIKKDYYTNGNKYLALVELESLLPMP